MELEEECTEGPMQGHTYPCVSVELYSLAEFMTTNTSESWGHVLSMPPPPVGYAYAVS